MQPPQNPYNQPSYGSAPYGAPTPQQPRGTVSLDVIGEAWSILSANLGVWIGAGAIYLAFTLVINLLQRMTQTTGPRGLPQNTPVSLLLALVGIAAGQFLLGGLLRMALSAVKTGRTEISLLFSAGNVVPSLIVAGLITGVAFGIGLVLCIVPGLIVAAGLVLAPTIIVDGRSGAIGALGESWGVMKSNLGPGILFLIVMGLILIVSAIPVGLGLLVTIPLLQIALVLVYRDLFGIGGTPVQNMGYTPPPIANPNF